MEIPKFLKGDYSSDSSMLAQWLRVIDGLNKETPVPVSEGSLFARLQEKAKLSIFTEEFLVSEAMNMSDHLYEMYVEKKHARAEGLAEGRAEGIQRGIFGSTAAGSVDGEAFLFSLVKRPNRKSPENRSGESQGIPKQAVKPFVVPIVIPVTVPGSPFLPLVIPVHSLCHPRLGRGSPFVILAEARIR